MCFITFGSRLYQWPHVYDHSGPDQLLQVKLLDCDGAILCCVGKTTCKGRSKVRRGIDVRPSMVVMYLNIFEEYTARISVGVE
jgi:hypothetical protein